MEAPSLPLHSPGAQLHIVGLEHFGKSLATLTESRRI